MFSYKAILIVGVIFACFFCSTESDSSEEIKIKSVIDVMKNFFKAVNNLDAHLELPDDYEKLKKIRTRHWIIWFSIRKKESDFKDFLKEYGKLVKYSRKIVEKYIKKIDELSVRTNISSPYFRQQFCAIYNDEFFDKKLKLKGYGKDDEELNKLQGELKDEAKKLVSKISGLVDLFYEVPVMHDNEADGGDTTIVIVNNGGEEEEASSSSAEEDAFDI